VSSSQEELAIASGVNLRTIQRIESEASASLQSKKALASALDLDVDDLDYQETPMRPIWEYQVVETKDRAALQSELTTAGGDGWELVSATAMFNTMMISVVYTLFFKSVLSKTVTAQGAKNVGAGACLPGEMKAPKIRSVASLQGGAVYAALVDAHVSAFAWTAIAQATGIAAAGCW
jgi:transcriptional regulator with XRE-family HTH domain